jgi:DMSO/TMAO reductase YedYZ molybdopterin-dependent catalytic subunit
VSRERLQSPIPPLVGALVAIAATFLLRTTAGTKLLAEVVVDASTYGLQPKGFSFLLSLFGPAGKPLLFASVVIGEICIYLIAWRLAAVRIATRSPMALIGAATFISFAVRMAATIALVLFTVASLGTETGWLQYGAVALLTSGLFAATAGALALPAEPVSERRTATEASAKGRRDLLLRIPVFVAGAAALGLIARQVLRTAGGGAQTSHPGQPSEEVTSNADYYVVSKNLVSPKVNGKTWRLKVGGLVPRMLEFTYDDILSLPAIDQYTAMQCISNEVNGDLFSNALWRGIPLKDFIAMANPSGQARYVAFRSSDDYTESLPLDFARGDGLLLAHTMNGVPLPSKHGFPLRLLSPGKYGMKHPKWLIEIAFFEQEFFGYWEQRGWSQENRMNTSTRIDVPADGGSIRESPFRISGIAFAGNRGIQRVEVSTDNGATWADAVLKPALSPYSWVLWHYDWAVTAAVRVRILARATDGTGEVQTSESAPPYPAGATGYPAVTATVRMAV